MIRTVVAAIFALALLASACSSGDGDSGTPESRSLSEGDTIGRIERLPGGTPVASDVRTLIALSCEAATLLVRTDEETITAPMPCDRLPPPSVVERFAGQPVAIAYAGGRLKIENETAGTLEFPVDGAPQVRTDDVTPAP